MMSIIPNEAWNLCSWSTCCCCFYVPSTFRTNTHSKRQKEQKKERDRYTHTHDSCALEMSTYYINSSVNHIRFICKSPSIGLPVVYVQYIRYYTLHNKTKIAIECTHQRRHTAHVLHFVTSPMLFVLLLIHFSSSSSISD